MAWGDALTNYRRLYSHQTLSWAPVLGHEYYHQNYDLFIYFCCGCFVTSLNPIYKGQALAVEFG